MERYENYPTVDVVFDPETGTYTSGPDETGRMEPSETVVETVAVATGSDPVQMRPLYEVVDLDALNALFEPTTDSDRRDNPGAVDFRYERCEVTVESTGRTVVEPTDGRRE